MLIEIHWLKNYPASNLNRDDTGAPKTEMFGGTMRGRISSQCLKRSWRTSELLLKEIGAENIGIRTRKLPELVETALQEKGYPQEWIDIVKKKVADFGKNTDKGKKDTEESAENKAEEENDKKKKKKTKEKDEKIQTKQIIFYSPADIDEVVKQVELELEKIARREDLEDAQKIREVEKINPAALQKAMADTKKRAITLDMALFGRMVTSEAFANVEATIQVAPAMGVNRVFMESDYFTAVDDLINREEGEQGSAIMDVTDYNSSCYYMYASLDTDKLRANLKNSENADEIIRRAIPALIRTMVFTNPSGKQHSWAANIQPSAVLVECKNCRIPVSLANAYEIPVRADGNNGIVEESVKRLKDECLKINRGYGIPVGTRLWYTPEQKTFFEDSLTVNCKTFAELIDQLPNV